MNRKTLTAVGVFTGLLLAVFLTREEKVEAGLLRIEVARLDRASVTGVEISGAQAATLRKVAEGWQVRDATKTNVFYPAEETQVSQLFDALDSFRTQDVVTENASRHGELEVDEAKGLRVKVLTQKGPAVDLVLGKQGQGGGTYVRQANAPAVFTTEGSLVWSARKEAKAWRRHGMVKLTPEEATQLSVEHADGEKWALNRQEASWKLPADFALPRGFRFDEGFGNRVVQQLSTLSAQDFLDSPGSLEALGLKPARTTVRATLKDGKAVTVFLGQAWSTADMNVINRLNGQFSSFDANNDGFITQEEVVKGELDAQAAVKELATSLKNGSLYARIDLGGMLGGTGDGRLSRDDVSSAQRVANGVPAQVEGDAQVYQIARSTAELLGARLEAMRDLSLLAVAADDVQKLELSFKGTKVTVAREQDSWKLVEPRKAPADFELAPQQAMLQVNLIRNLKAQRLAKGVDAAQAGFSKPTLVATFFTKDGKTQKLQFGREFRNENGETEVYVRGTLDNETYVLPVFARNRLEQGVDLFKRPNSSMNGMSGLQNLPPDIRAKLESQLQQKFTP